MSQRHHYVLSDLRHPDRDVRLRAALAAGERAEQTAAPELVARLRDEPDFFVRDTMSWAITRLAPAATDLLLAELLVPCTEVRVQALHVLSKIADPATTDALIPWADDDDPAVAAKARWALTSIGDIRALPALTAHLGHGDEHQWNNLTRDLASFGDAAVPALIEALSDDRPTVRGHAAEVLNVIGPAAHRAVRSLIPAVQDVDAHVRLSAAMALYEIRTRAALDVLDAHRDSSDPRVRAIAHRAYSPV